MEVKLPALLGSLDTTGLLHGKFSVVLGNLSISNDNLTMKKPKSVKNKDDNFFALQDSKTVLVYVNQRNQDKKKL